MNEADKKVFEHKINILNMPAAQNIWDTLGSNFSSADQAIKEFIDNALSNFRAYPFPLPQRHQVKISVHKLGDDV